jgi:hypothetical protein
VKWEGRVPEPAHFTNAMTSSSSASPPSAPTAGCYVDLYELPAQRGKLRRLYGPAVYSALRGRGTEGDVRIESLTVGPRAFALWYNHRDPERHCVWLSAGQVIPNWSAAGGLHASMDSLQLLDRPPQAGDPCAQAYFRSTKKG